MKAAADEKMEKWKRHQEMIVNTIVQNDIDGPVAT
jgi:hypothetical protein